MAFRLDKSADVEAGLFFTLFGRLTAGLSWSIGSAPFGEMGPGMFPLILGDHTVDPRPGDPHHGP